MPIGGGWDGVVDEGGVDDGTADDGADDDGAEDSPVDDVTKDDIAEDDEIELTIDSISLWDIVEDDDRPLWMPLKLEPKLLMIERTSLSLMPYFDAKAKICEDERIVLL